MMSKRRCLARHFGHITIVISPQPIRNICPAIFWLSQRMQCRLQDLKPQQTFASYNHRLRQLITCSQHLSVLIIHFVLPPRLLYISSRFVRLVEVFPSLPVASDTSAASSVPLLPKSFALGPGAAKTAQVQTLQKNDPHCHMVNQTVALDWHRYVYSAILGSPAAIPACRGSAFINFGSMIS